MHVVGVDGRKGGWLAVSYDLETHTLTPQRHATFAEILGAYPNATIITIDIPIGLTTADARLCDREARQLLTRLCGSSVFPAPDPRIVNAPTYQEARLLSQSLKGKGVSSQAFGIYPKVVEVNRLMTPAMQELVVEIHPEICFWALANRRPLEHAKKTPDGFDERRSLLMAAFGDSSIPALRDARRWAQGAAPDDALDAIAAAWTARRLAEGRSGRLPLNPEKNADGVRMEMAY